MVAVAPTEPITFNPHQYAQAKARLLVWNTFEALLTHDDKGGHLPWLATGYETSPDGKTYTFRLRTDVSFTDGTPVDGPDALRAALLDRSGAFVTTATEKLMTYALGRRLEHYDMPAIRAIVRDAAGDDYRFASLVQGIVASDAFRMRVVAEVE